MTVFGSVAGFDLVVDLKARLFRESDVFLQATRLDVAFVEYLRPAEPGGDSPINGSDIEVVTKVINPNNNRVSKVAIASK